MAHPSHVLLQSSIVKRSMKSKPSWMPGDMGEDVSCNTSCIGKATPIRTTRGSITRTSTPRKFSKNSYSLILTPPRLDDLMYKYAQHHPHRFLYPPLDTQYPLLTNTLVQLLSVHLSTSMSRPSTPIYVSSRDSTPTPQPTPSLVRAQVQALAEASRSFLQERIVNMDDATMDSICRMVSHGAIIGHWAHMFNAPISEVLRAFSSTPSVALPLLLGETSPSSSMILSVADRGNHTSLTLEYPEEEESSSSPPPLPVPPPITDPEIAEINAAVLAMANLPGPNCEPITPTDPVPSMPSSPPPFLEDGPRRFSPVR